MSKERLPSNGSLLHTPLVTLGNFLEDFVCAQRGPASIKVPKKENNIGHYAVCNEALSCRDGILIENYIGLTAYDIASVMKYTNQSTTDNAVEADSKIFKGILPYIQYTQGIPIDGGLLSIEKVTKKPILSKDNQVIGLLAYAHDITQYLDPLYLFSQYQQHHPTKEAIRHFLQHLKIQHFFYALPTKRELETLLIMRKSNSTKYIAKVMQLSPKTVDENKGRLRNNLKLITLQDLVIQLRTRNEFHTIHTDHS